MKKSALIICFVALILQSAVLSGQDTTRINTNSFEFPADKFGISIGNSYEFTGLRLNFRNKNVRVNNGLNLTVFGGESNLDATMNGVNVSLYQMAGKMQPVNVGILGMMAGKMNGLSIGGLLVGAGEQLNGFSASGLVTMVEGGNLNGLGLSGLTIIVEGDSSKIQGLAIAGLFLAADYGVNGLAVSPMIASDGNLNGATLGPAIIWSNAAINGLALTAGYLRANKINGFTAAGYSKTKETNGVSVAIYNNAEALHGIQFGLLNHAGNNPKLFRTLPIINIHFSKRDKLENMVE